MIQPGGKIKNNMLLPLRHIFPLATFLSLFIRDPHGVEPSPIFT
ncbi:hypothetical protein SAMN05444156_2703 [Verrucomicrobium sp. GAS474]|nr:hypothetical protein SAMN05444156_2703 [Verrucomicrobium sp. GAS474]